jgi:hypothetical protein
VHLTRRAATSGRPPPPQANRRTSRQPATQPSNRRRQRSADAAGRVMRRPPARIRGSAGRMIYAHWEACYKLGHKFLRLD